MFILTFTIVFCQEDQYSKNYTNISLNTSETDHSDEKVDPVVKGISIFFLLVRYFNQQKNDLRKTNSCSF